MVTKIEQEVKSGPIIAISFCMRHLGDATVEIELRAYPDGYALVSE